MSIEDYKWHTAYIGVTKMLETSLTVSMARHRINGGKIA
jgi:hypothetical protein